MIASARASRHFHRPVERPFTEDQRGDTTVLLGGLSPRHDALVEAAVQALGYRCKALPNTSLDAYQRAKAYGNSGQCNPTYFTVGNLVKYLQDLLSEGFCLPGEEEAFADFADSWLRPPTCDGLSFRRGPLSDPGEILEEIAAVGRYTVERGLVDSYFGNISCLADGVIYISQTAASLDSLRGCIDPVPLAATGTAGITASSELPAHRRIYETCGARTVLHGHPRFAVVMSLFCDDRSGPVKDCWRECDKVRFLGKIPIVAGEIGAGGLANRVPPVIASHGKAIVYGHGVFAAGERDFAEAFRGMVEVENLCREEYFRRLRSRHPSVRA